VLLDGAAAVSSGVVSIGTGIGSGIGSGFSAL